MEKVRIRHEGSLREIATVLAETAHAQLIEDFLYCLLTQNELENISTRWELVKLIDEGMSQRRIAEKLGLSLCKITRGSKELKKEDSAFEKMLRTLRRLRRLPRTG